VEDRGRLQRVPYSIPPCLLLGRLIDPGGGFGPIHVKISVLGSSGCAIRPVYEASPEFGVHLVKLPQCLRVQVDVDGIESYRYHIMYAHLDGRIPPLRAVGRQSVKYLGEGLQRKRRSGDLERRVRARCRGALFLGYAYGEYGPGDTM
jgi:hypothetical protein